ncbi:Putative tartrate transporter [Paraburkholderia graminis C4D1M]|uniref:Major facilitator superfamily MFS_1 n=1 Tax=Paraburkholderia graminis (strain ATCC 700544 / DSM 17151 / LMG 18924 / NCIMB 13744 / C4D1M) TaxID=396598 RepID=B1G6I6_PARG4|nr:MFS transporter [Paraburkholderia graminis]EDT08233.1 major facilitator superfamily MFS_1 [Paraburkholderia graminis C4D1M]CAB3723493.1 Putative tartrate transporter [Paraburkholderia graminis C4D1M]
MKQRWFRLLPVMMIAFIIGFMDRTNVGFAIPTMGGELGLTSSILGFASGVLFVGYGIAQPICGWIADRGYGKPMIALMMVLWGIAEISQSAVHTAPQLVAVRFAIGLFEGGIFPTFLLFVKNWFAPSERARANGVWQLCYPLAALLSGPIAGYILQFGSWRTLFIIEGIFPILWVAVWLWGVADSPRNAKWLDAGERERILERIAQETRARALQSGPQVAASFGSQIRRPSILIFMASILLWNVGFLGFVIWLPSVIHQQPGLSSATTGWLSAIPYGFAMLVMPVLTYWSDRTLERRLLCAIPLAIAGIALAVGGITYASNAFAVNMALLVVAGAMLYGSQPVLWSIATELLPQEVAGALTGTINGVGVIGAFAGPYIVGYVRSLTNSFSSGLLAMGVSLVATSALLLLITEVSRPRRATRSKSVALQAESGGH